MGSSRNKFNNSTHVFILEGLSLQNLDTLNETWPLIFKAFWGQEEIKHQGLSHLKAYRIGSVYSSLVHTYCIRCKTKRNPQAFGSRLVRASLMCVVWGLLKAKLGLQTSFSKRRREYQENTQLWQCLKSEINGCPGNSMLKVWKTSWQRVGGVKTILGRVCVIPTSCARQEGRQLLRGHKHPFSGEPSYRPFAQKAAENYFVKDVFSLGKCQWNECIFIPVSTVLWKSLYGERCTEQ